MWQLCFGVGYSSYSSVIDTPIRHSIQPLDPIEVAGHADLNAIRRSAVRVNAEFVIDKLNIIMDRECFVSQMKSTIKVTPIKRWTNQKYASHFETLQACGVLKECKANEVQWYSPYFSVAKDTFFDRSIFNGSRMSTFFNVPTPVNTLDAPRVLKMICDLNRINGYIGLSFICGDLRHWFLR